MRWLFKLHNKSFVFWDGDEEGARVQISSHTCVMESGMHPIPSSQPLTLDSQGSNVSHLLVYSKSNYQSSSTILRIWLQDTKMPALRNVFSRRRQKINRESVYYSLSCKWASLVAKVVKNMLALQGIWFQSLGQGDGLEKGMATPLQYSCLENSMDRGAWWAIHGVTESWTRLSD